MDAGHAPSHGAQAGAPDVITARRVQPREAPALPCVLPSTPANTNTAHPVLFVELLAVEGVTHADVVLYGVLARAVELGGE